MNRRRWEQRRIRMRVTEHGAWLFLGERQVALCVPVNGTVDKAAAVASLRWQWREHLRRGK